MYKNNSPANDIFNEFSGSTIVNPGRHVKGTRGPMENYTLSSWAFLFNLSMPRRHPQLNLISGVQVI